MIARLDDLIDKLTKHREQYGDCILIPDGLGEEIEIESIEEGHAHDSHDFSTVYPVCVILLKRKNDATHPKGKHD